MANSIENSLENLEAMAEKVCQAQETVPQMSGETAVNLLKSKSVFTYEQRALIYSGEDRLMINKSDLQRVYELEKMNDQFQRAVLNKELSIHTSEDPFMVLADIEYTRMQIARNSGEILKIFETTANRITRIAELEQQNAELRQENQEKQAAWTTNHNMQERSYLAAGTLLNLEKIARNEAELATLREVVAA